MATVLENGSSSLKISPEVYERFQKQQKCAFDLGMDLYIFGEVIHELLSRNPKYNPLKVVSGIFVGELNEETLDELVKKFFIQPRKMSVLDRMVTYYHSDGVDCFYFLPDFDPLVVNTLYGITLDQIYYQISSNKVFDPSGRGISDFNSLPINIRSTVPYDQWTNEILFVFLFKIGLFYDSKIDDEDYDKLKVFNFSRPHNIEYLLTLNRPGSSLNTLIQLCPNAKTWIFDTLLRCFSEWGIQLRENIKPSQVFTDEKLKLLNLYSDYFISSGSPSEKRNKDKLLAKLLVDI